MLENRKNVRKIISILLVLLMIMIMVLGGLPHISIAAIDLGEGQTIIPQYKPEWTKVSSTLDTDNKKLTVTLKGAAYQETQTINDNVTINYASDVTSTLEMGDIEIYIDGVDVTSRFTNKSEAIDTTVPMKELKTGATSTNEDTGKTEITYDFVLYNFEEAIRQSGASYKEMSGNISLKIKGRGQDSTTYSENVLTDEYGNQSMMETDENGTNDDGTWIDVTFEDAETNKNATGTMFADFIKPEFTYLSSETIVDKDNKILTVVFSAVDKYFDAANSSLSISDLTLMVDGDAVDVDADGNTLTDEAIYENGTRIGTKYTLVVKNLQKNEGNDNDGFSYSGIVSIGVPANKFKDYSGNANDATTLTIGVDETDGNANTEVDENGRIVDIVDPVWKMENIDIGENNVTFDLIATDKYYSSNTLTSGMTDNLIPDDKMLIYIDGVLDGDANGNGVLDEGETPTITKTLTATADLATAETGVKYTIILGNWNSDEYSGTTKIVIPADTIVDDYENTSVEQEFTIGHIDLVKPVIEIVSTTNNDDDTQTIVFKATDKFMDTSDLVTIPDETNPDAPDEITVYIDGEVATGITRTLTVTSKIVRNKSTGTVTNQATNYVLADNESVIGHEYTLVLSDFEQASKTREFTDWSGTVEIVVAEGAVKDIQVTNPNGEVAGGNLNSETTLNAGFVDVIKPNVDYMYYTSDINTTDKKYTMTFSVTDKYYTSGELTLADLTILMQNGQYERVLDEDGQWQYKTDENGNKVPLVYDLKELATQGKISIIGFNAVPKTVSNVKVTNATTGEIETVETHTIGHTYTLTIEGLEQLEIDVNRTTLDYSGVITVAIAENVIKDRGTNGDGTNQNGNNGTTITTGVNVEGGIQAGTSGKDVDVVDPIWEKVSSSAYAIDPENNESSTATITFRGTDTYFDESTLTSDDIQIINTLSLDDIKVLVNNAEVTTGITKTLDATTVLTESRIVDGVETSDVKYGIEYTITIKGFAQGANQVKIQIPKGAMVDLNGNDSEVTELIVYNVLRLTNTETEATSPFLGSTDTAIQRQNIENVTFLSSTETAPETGWWDASAQGDNSIIAWATQTTDQQTNGTYTVYIASDNEIFANQNSSYLFSYIGYGENCTATETVTNLHLLNETSVTNMSWMFQGFGYRAMTELDLGEFDTSNVVDMESMFSFAGYSAMTTFDLGDNFDTSNVLKMNGMFYSVARMSGLTSFSLGNKFDTSSVTNMSYMFTSMGEYNLEALDLGEKFDTSSVTNMEYMFGYTGAKKLKELDLGQYNFDTSNVTNMKWMFNGCGKEELTTFSLGNEFDTSNVTDMYCMFQDFGGGLTSLDLGDKFDTRKVTNMNSMFANTSSDATLKIIDLGPAFTKIPDGTITITDGESTTEISAYGDFMKNCGKSGELTIYAPESIYSSQNSFKLSSTSTTTITLDVIDDSTDPDTYRGTINPIYKPEWTHTSSLDTTNQTLTVTVKGSAYKSETINSDVTINYASNVTSTLTVGDITVFVDGVEVTDTTNPTIVVDSAEGQPVTSTNETSGKTERTHTIVLSNLEQAVRQAGKQYKEWSGNIAIKIAGRGEETSTYTANVLVDEYGNQNMMETDEGQTAGTWIDVKIEDTAIDTNTDGTMFADFIKPEFTYVYSESDINYENKTLTVVFDAIDKYFASSTLAVTDLNILVDGVAPTWATTEEAAAEGNTKPVREFTSITDVTDTTTGATIGKRYTLLLSNLEQVDGNGFGDGFTYSGVVTIAIPEEKVTDKSGNTNDATTITVGINVNGGSDGESEESTDEILPSTEYTTPYLPTGYSYVEGDLDSGLVIADSLGNEYVWVEVPKSTEVYTASTLALDLDSLSGDALTTAYNTIESELQTYTSTYRNGTTYTDTWYSEEQHGFANADEYNKLKYKMLKSVFTNGGFYVGRYEAGTTTARTSSGNELTTAIIQQNAYPYNYVTNAQAQSLASEFASNLDGYESSLMFGVQWDLVLKYIETKGAATVAELNSDSTSWGNYYNNLWNVTNTNAKYYASSTWTDGAYGKKTSSSSVLLSTGADSSFSKMGIYDIAGNVREWTLEKSTSNQCANRTGNFYLNGSSYPASYRAEDNTTFANNFIGFRVALYEDVDLSSDSDTSEEGTIVDVVDPVWELVGSNLSTGEITIRARDKYFDTSTLTTDDITVYINGTASDVITKTLSEPIEIENGVQYTLQLGNITPEGGAYVEFTPTNVNELVGKTAKYRNENGGDVSIEIKANTAIDESGNGNKKTPIYVGNMDETSPEIYDIQKTQDATANTETFIFNVTDKNYDPTDLITLDEITVWLDGVQTDSIVKSSLTYKEIKTTIDGSVKTVGHQYTLVVSEITETYAEFYAEYAESGREYKELSGTLEIKIDPTAARDIKQNTINPETTTISDFVDFIKPAITYKYTESTQAVPGDINYGAKTFTMVFDVIDKYIKESTLKTELDNATLAIINATTDEEKATAETAKQEIIEEILEILIDTQAPDWSKVNKDLTITELESETAFNKTVDGEFVNDKHVIGYRYTLTLSNLEQLEITADAQYPDYSGVITAVISAGIESDTKGNTNDGTTLTSGIDLVGSVVVPDEESEVVDVVDPVWQKVSSSANAIDPDNTTSSTGTITIKGTDKFYKESILTQDNIKTYIKVYANTGSTPSSTTTTDVTESVNITVSEATAVYNNTDSTNQIGDEYTLTITGFAQDVNQIKIAIQPGAMTDESGNTNKATEMIVYNVLRLTNNEGSIYVDEEEDVESSAAQPFLGNTTIQRQNVENVTFLTSTETAPETGWWDVSAAGDDSIIAWATQTESQATAGTYTVYIASDYDIFANQNSSYLFSYIGYSANCTATETITGIELLNTSSVTNMRAMFQYCGYTAMTSLDLGDKFDTSNVINMAVMFQYCGYTAMTDLKLIPSESATEEEKATKFDTSKVTDMSFMFNFCGYTAMTSLDLGTNFNTSQVTDMGAMFQDCGYTAMTTLDLGDKFNTGNVTNMSYMFFKCGYTAMTSLDLSSETTEETTEENTTQFNTSKVTDMSYMFSYCGYTAMTELNLGSNFNTGEVIDMSHMFSSCGYTAMTSLDLENKFNTSNVTNMEYMFRNCGYMSMTSLDLGDLFDTSDVTSMNSMFYGCGRTAMTSLDLGDKFYTTNVTNMKMMFMNCGYNSMTTLDLGPAFTKIPEGTGAVFCTWTGVSGCTIYASEQIYNDMAHFKLNTDSTTTIEYEGTITPIYKPEWEKVSSSLDTSTGTMTVVVKGSANKTFTNGDYTGTYVSDVASTLATGDVTVYVDDELADDVTVTVGTATTSTNGTTNATEVQQTITFNLEKTVRRSGKNFLEWSGNISLQFAKGTLRDKYGSYLTTQTETDEDGNSVEVTVPITNVFTDADGNYIGNGNLAEIDTGTTTDADGNTVLVMENIVVEDENAPLTENTETPSTEANMFSDTIEPEFTYEYYNTETDGDTDANTIIDYVNNKVTVVFDVTDKYFKEAKITADDITVIVDEDANADTAISKELTKTGIFVMNKETKEITIKSTDYTINEETEQITGERYQLVVTGLESANGVGYSGPMSLVFPAGQTDEDENGDTVLVKGMIDNSGNLNSATTITIGIDQPGNHEDHNTAVVVDVVNPIWVGLRDANSIDRINDTVSIKILGIDKYYKTNTLSTDKITVYIDIDGNGTIEDTEILDLDPDTDMALTAIDSTELGTLKEDEELANYDNVAVGYTLTLSGFGNYSGMTKIEIADGTIEDLSGNLNTNTDPIFAGNIGWVEENEPLESSDENYPRYTAFRNDIVDFIDPVINYEYSVVEGEENPDIDYEQKTVTVKFTVTDKYLLESDLIKTTTDADGNTIQIPNNMSIIVDGTTVYDSSLETQNYQVTASITVDSTDITDGEAVYTLVVSNIQQEVDASTNTTPSNGDGFNFSGTMQLVFNSGAIEDTSGNTNALTTITLDTEIGDDIVDVVDPIIKYYSSSIDRANNTVSLRVKAEDKYLASETLSTAENTVKVKVVDEDGNVIVNDATTITKDITIFNQKSQYIYFDIELSNFGVYEGITSIIIPAGLIKDSSGNGNVETEILVGSSSDTSAFKDSIVDFTKPTWEYETSSINREVDANGVRTETGTVTLEVKGTDIYFDKANYYDNDYQLDLDTVKVYVDGVENTSITKTLKAKEYIEESKELATDYSRVLKGVKYTIELGNFGTNEGTVKIEIPKDAIKDTSTNGNIETQIDVGNPEWIETVGLGDETEDTESPKYTAFRNDIVDFIKPVIKYQYVADTNPALDRTNETVDITFTVTDTNFLESNIGLEDMKIYIDNMQVYGDGANADTAITPSLSTPTATDTNDGLEYTLTLSVLELNRILDGEIFERHSGVIKIVFAADQVADTSGNKNVETTLIIDNGDGDDQANGVIVDFVNPNIYYQDKYLNWEEEYALITLRATDRFYDTDTELSVSDLTFYEQNDDGDWINITNNFTGNITITKSNPLTVDGNIVGYDYTIRLDGFEEEFKMKIVVAGNVIGDTSGNLNDATDIFVDLDNRRPTWNYVSTDSTSFESEGKISFTIKGVDKFLDIENSGLEVADIKVLKDGVDITNSDNITVTHIEDDEDEKSRTYQIDITELSEMGTYSLVIAKETLVDEFENKSAATTISFSNSVIASNTENYVNVTYHITPDMETVHKSYVHELMSVNTTGTNFENTTYRASTIGELFNNGENPLFAEPMYIPSVDGYTIGSVYSPKSFEGWVECDENGKVAADATIYGLYVEIPNTVTHLKAVWQDATLVFVSSSSGNNSNDGKLPTTPVKDLATAYGLINSSGTAENNIIVIMDEVEYNSSATLSGNATITSLYAGVDYRAQGAELKISSNMIVDGDITFDNIELYTASTTVSFGEDYLGNDTYSNMLISNYSGDIIIGRGVTTPSDKYTFGAIIGGNFGTETSTGDLGTHTIRIEAGKYNNIIAGSTLSSSTTASKSITHNVIIGNMRDAAVSRNDKLTITGYVAIGENEQNCYPRGATNTNAASTRNYANVTLYSGTFTGDNKFAKATENVAIYLRSINGQTDGLMNFEMFGGDVNANIYGGAASTTYTTDNYNTMKFYGGQVTGNIFGQSANDTFAGSSTITLQGEFSITGNVFGGSNVTATTSASVGEGNSVITINSSSVTVNGNIYGGGNAPDGSTEYIAGTTTITLRAGTVSNIYGSGYNSSNTGATNITIENGVVNENIFGGAYQGQARTASNITVLGGTVHGNIYGGNNNSESQLEGDTYDQDVTITIGDTDATTKPTVKGTIYGGGKYDYVDVVTIYLLENEAITSVYGGSDTDATTSTANIYLQGMTVNEIYGGGQSAGTGVVSNIYLQSGTVTDVYGGGFGTSLTQSNITLEGTATVTSIYGGSNTSGTVTKSYITLTSGNVTNVFGGGNSASVGTANVTLDGVTIDQIHGGSKDAGVTTTTNVTLKSGTVKEVFGGGLDVGVTTANIKQQGATVTTIYGGNDSGTGNGGDTGTTNIEIVDSTVENVYGGNKEKGTTNKTNITIHGASTITGNVFGGGYKSDIGKDGESGSTTINIAGGTIKGDINGGSELAKVYGNTTINIGDDAVGNSSLTPGAVNIIGTIYGAGSTQTDGEVTVVGNTNILMDNNTSYPITYFKADGVTEKSIYGSGNGGAIYSNGTSTDSSTIHIKDFGTSDTPYLFKSIEDTGNLYIGNSVIELSGALDTNDTEVGHYYTLNTITNALTIYSNTTLYTQRGFNKVGGFYSYVNQKSTKATVSITDGVATTNVDNRLYTLEGINLIFAKEEVTLTNKSTLEQDDWGDVTGMAYFGMYKNTSTGKEYDLDLFKAGTYVEGLYRSNRNTSTDGFYTTVADESTGAETAQVIDTTNYTYYSDWIINAPTVDYDIDLVASTYGQNSVVELLLNALYASDYEYAAETVYTLNQVSTNALKTGIELVDPIQLSTISSDANNKFGLTMETMPSGWQQQALTKIYSANNGSFDGDSVYTSDTSSTPGSIKFKIYNSLNITEEKDLGTVNIILTGQQPINETGTEAYTFNVVITVNLQTIVDELKEQYTPSFTDSAETELSYTADSRVDLSYILYKDMETTPYTTDAYGNITDYRVISTTVQLPAGTKLTMKDYGQGDNLNKVYYYQVASNTDYDSTETVDGITRYIYKLSKFAEMGSTNDSYVDSTTYYHSDDKYVLEKYDISIDFIDSNINTDKVAQETYLELRNASGNVKYDNGDITIKYNLYAGQNAEATIDIETDSTSYSVVESIDIPITISASLLEQSGIMDTKYYDQIAGIAVQIVGEDGIRIKSPELQNFKLTDNDTGESYEADSNGTIRMPIIEGLGSKSGNYTLSIAQADVTPGTYKVQVMLYTADDGLYYGTEAETEPAEFNITFISRLTGLLGVETENDASRIISTSTGLNLVDGSTTSNAIDMTIGVANPTDLTNIRVELYKRNATYTDLDDESTYTGTSYTLVDIKDYLQGTWTESVAGSKEYMVSEKKTYETAVDIETIEFEKAIIQGISTGEYKLVFKAYSDDTLVQTFSKTFIITE